MKGKAQPIAATVFPAVLALPIILADSQPSHSEHTAHAEQRCQSQVSSHK